MSGATRARAALAATEGWQGARLVRRLCHGRTTDTWELERDGERWLLRLDHRDAGGYGRERHAEVAVFAAAAAAGVAPPVAQTNPARGLLITRFVDGRAWTRDDTHEPAQLVRLARRLQALHACRPEIPAPDIGAAVRRYAAAIDDRAARAAAGDILALLAAAPRRVPVLCHNDLVCANIVDDGRELWLVDWEFGGLGNPLFDLAVVLAHHEVPPAARTAFIDAYFEGPSPLAELDLWCDIYAGVLALWQRFIANFER